MTQTFTDDAGDLYLLPDWTLEHAGFKASSQATGHVSITATSGSVFNRTVTPAGLIQAVLDPQRAQWAGVMIQATLDDPVGWSALTLDSSGATTGVLMKQEARAGSNVPCTVIAPAIASPSFGDRASQTRTCSMIAPFTTDLTQMDDDVRTDPRVVDALNRGRLRTIVSLFPGPAIVHGAPLPRISELQAGTPLAFRTRPDNVLYVPLALTPAGLAELVVRWNAQAMSNPVPVNVERDRAAITTMASTLEASFPVAEPTLVPTPLPRAQLAQRLDATKAPDAGAPVQPGRARRP